MNLRKFKPEDMIGDWVSGKIETAYDERVLSKGLNFTVVDEEEVISCGGIFMAVEPTFWVCVKKNIKKPIALVRTFKRFIKIAMNDLNINRAIGHIRVGFKQAEKLDRLLGFKPTGIQETINDKLYNRYEIWRGYQ